MKRAPEAEQERVLHLLQKTYGRTYALHLVRMIFRKNWMKVRTNYFYWVKRLFDIAISGVFLLGLAPLMLILGLLIKLDGGPALFSQMRIGRHGRPFRFWKFRSMVVEAEQLKSQLEQENEIAGGVLFKIKRDPRITPLGRIMRKLSLDELPQLWNVFRGDMSLVGPRPPLPEEVEHYSAQERIRLEANQGITCIWQVSGRSNIGFNEQVELDLEYIANESLWNDIKLLLKTLPAVITGRGAS